MKTLRILDIMSMKLFHLRETNGYPTKGYKIIILNAFGLSLSIDESMKGAVAIAIEFLPLRLFIGFNVSNRWVI